MGDASAVSTLEALRLAVRVAIGPPGQTLEHTVDVIVEEVCREWPEKAMAAYARNLDGSGGQVLDAIPVITARVREQIEARWGCDPSHKAALDLVLRACVIEVANLWFASVEHRIAMRRVIALVRQTART